VCDDGRREWVSMLDVRLPSGWDPAKKIGHSFADVHAPVPGMDTINRAGPTVVKMMIDKPPMQRFVWGVQYDDTLAHHPRRRTRGGFDPDRPNVFVRVERQVTVGFPSVRAALFIIRLYVYPLEALSADERSALADAIESMSPEARRYKGVDQHTEALLKHIRMTGDA